MASTSVMAIITRARVMASQSMPFFPEINHWDTILQKALDSELHDEKMAIRRELFKKRESLIKPIQDEVYEAIEDISKNKGLDLIFDKSSAMSAIFVSPKLDISDEVLKKLGYSK